MMTATEFVLVLLSVFSHITPEVTQAMELLLEIACVWGYFLEVPTNYETYAAARRSLEPLAELARAYGYHLDLNKATHTDKEIHQMLEAILEPVLSGLSEEDLDGIASTKAEGELLLGTPINSLGPIVQEWLRVRQRLQASREREARKAKLEAKAKEMKDLWTQIDSVQSRIQGKLQPVLDRMQTRKSNKYNEPEVPVQACQHDLAFTSVPISNQFDPRKLKAPTPLRPAGERFDFSRWSSPPRIIQRKRGEHDLRAVAAMQATAEGSPQSGLSRTTPDSTLRTPTGKSGSLETSITAPTYKTGTKTAQEEAKESVGGRRLQREHEGRKIKFDLAGKVKVARRKFRAFIKF